jgi:hypothetical protein
MRQLIHFRGQTFLVAGMVMALWIFPHEQANAQDPNVPSKKQQQCINTLNKDFQKVASKQGKEILTCLKQGSKGQLGPQTVEQCLTADNKGKVEKAIDKTLADARKKCTELPDFGPTDPNTVNAAAVQKEIDLAHAIFGTDLDAVIAPAAEKFLSKCQQKVTSKVKKCQDTKLKAFNKCKKDGLKGKPPGPITSAADLETCIFLDPEGEVATACIDKVLAQVKSQCVNKEVDLALAFPGIDLSDPNDPNELVDDLDQNVECLSCLALNEADALNQDCDAVDDGVVNGSCP